MLPVTVSPRKPRAGEDLVSPWPEPLSLVEDLLVLLDAGMLSLLLLVVLLWWLLSDGIRGVVIRVAGWLGGSANTLHWCLELGEDIGVLYQ